MKVCADSTRKLDPTLEKIPRGIGKKPETEAGAAQSIFFRNEICVTIYIVLNTRFFDLSSPKGFVIEETLFAAFGSVIGFPRVDSLRKRPYSVLVVG